MGVFEGHRCEDFAPDPGDLTIDLSRVKGGQLTPSTPRESRLSRFWERSPSPLRANLGGGAALQFKPHLPLSVRAEAQRCSARSEMSLCLASKVFRFQSADRGLADRCQIWPSLGTIRCWPNLASLSQFRRASADANPMLTKLGPGVGKSSSTSGQFGPASG